AKRADRISTLDERPDMRRTAQALCQDLRPAIEPDDDPSAVERPAVAWVHDGAAAGSDHAMDEPVGVGRAERLDGITFDPPERRFAVLSEDRRDRPPIGAVDALVEIAEGLRMSILAAFCE